jgi:predicted acyltransferase
MVITYLIYRFFAHSPWNGLTVADLVFPWFMWIMGVSLAISSHSKINKPGSSRLEMVQHVLKRSAILFFLGNLYIGIYLCLIILTLNKRQDFLKIS